MRRSGSGCPPVTPGTRCDRMRSALILLRRSRGRHDCLTPMRHRDHAQKKDEPEVDGTSQVARFGHVVNDDHSQPCKVQRALAEVRGHSIQSRQVSPDDDSGEYDQAHRSQLQVDVDIAVVTLGGPPQMPFPQVVRVPDPKAAVADTEYW